MELVDCQFEEIMDGFFDGPHATPAPSESGPIFMGIKNIREQGGLDLTNIRHISEEDFPKWTKRVTPRKGDIVFSYEATLHRYAIIPEGFHGCLGRRMALIRLNPRKANNRFLYYNFLSPYWRAFVESNKITGATVDRISIIDFPLYKIGLPDMATQKTVANILTTYDELIDNNNQRISLLEQMAEEIYKEWFVRLRFPGHQQTRFVDGVPDGWKKLPLTSTFAVLSGGTPKTTTTQYWGGKIPFFSPKDSHGELYCLDTESYISELGLANCNSDLFPEDTIIVTARGTVGNIVLAGVPMAMNQSCFALQPRKGYSIFFVYHLLKCTVAMLKQIANGATFDAITIRTFEQTRSVVPTSDLTLQFGEFVQPFYAEVKVLQKKNKILKQTRDLLLPRLMSGRLSVAHLLSSGF